ncbi:MAG: pyridoxal phosphate-dependent aminotransferase [Gemmatimonadaceae bacterium]|nr:pyridoxal phosphate-dependent aminotransferase [Gemmatimonadaceae bacterium]NUQ94705.1 pyridoxal phosphate-dependent aminotransferase [Gemmatimonadaceae bacterium]
MATTNLDNHIPTTTREAPHSRGASRLASLSGEGALDVLSRARQLEAQGRRVAHLEIGEPQFAPAPHIVEAAQRALAEGDARYGPPAGLPALRGAIVDALARRGVSASAESLLVTPGAKTAVFYAILATVNPGDEVLLPDPGFPIYASMTRFVGATPVGYTLDVDDIASKITPRTRVICLNAPNNPTGGTFTQRDVDRLGDLVLQHDLLVVSDEIYGRIVFDDPRGFTPSIASLPGLLDRTILVDGFSKAYAMTGYRLGYALLPRWLIERATVLAVNGHTCTPPFVQRAGVAALTGPQDAVHAMVAELKRRRDLIVAKLRGVPGVDCPTPAGAFYAFPDVSGALRASGLTIRQLADRLLTERGVALLPGTGFGAGGATGLRISFAGVADDVTTGIDAVADFFTALAA